MGWNPFKSKEVIQVGTSVVRVVEDSVIVDSTKVGLTKALMNDGNIPDYLMEELVGSIGVKAERMYRYAEQHYTYGLPSGEQYASTQGRQEVEEVIETQIEGKQVFMLYSHFGTPNTLHIGWTKLVASYGYDYGTNELDTLTANKGSPVWLKDMVVVVPADRLNTIDSRALEQWGVAPCAGYTPERPMSTGEVRNFASHSPINTSTTDDLHVRVTYVWKDNGVLQEESIKIFMPEFDIDDGYFHASYLVDGEVKFWMYKNDAGTYPTLDAVFVEGPAVSGSYFPFAYFRYNKASTTGDPNSQAYKTTKKMVKYLGMDYEAVANSINENPDVADVEQAMLVLGVPPVSTNPAENRYLFDYFDNLHAVGGGNASATAAAVLSKIAAGNESFNTIASSLFNDIFTSHTILIQDARFKMALSHGGVFKRLVAGTLGVVGTYTSSYGATSVQTPSVDEYGSETMMQVPVKVHRYQHQLSKNLYEEVLVCDLKMTYYVWGGYTTVGDETDSILLIPVDRAVTQTYEISLKEQLYARSMHFVFNSRVVTKVKWYQQSWFKIVMIIIAIAIIYFTGGTGSKFSAAIVEFVGITGTAAIVAAIVIDVVLTGMIFQKIFPLFVKVFGQDVATLIAVAAMVYLGYQVSVNGVAGAPYAGDLLMLSNGLSQAVLQAKMSDLMDQAKMFELYRDDQVKELDEANKLLENQVVLSPFTIFGEKPEEYFNRTVHYGNIGTLGITAISSYVDMALTLPKIQDTLGEPIYG